MTCSILSLDACLAGIWTGLWAWVPDWVWPLLPYWPWALGAVALGLLYRFAGPLGLAVGAAAIGYGFGRRSVEPVNEHVPANTPDALPPVGRPKPAARPSAAGVKRPPDPPRSLTE